MDGHDATAEWNSGLQSVVNIRWVAVEVRIGTKLVGTVGDCGQDTVSAKLFNLYFMAKSCRR